MGKSIKKPFSEYKGKTSKGQFKHLCLHETNTLTAQQISFGSKQKFRFECDVCFHFFYAQICNVTAKQCTWCPFCQTALCDDLNCKMCFYKSLASFNGKTEKGNLKIDCFLDSNLKTTRQISLNSGQKAEFKCDNCNHCFSLRVASITQANNWCPYCCAKRRTAFCPKEANCVDCWAASFASFDGKTENGKLKVECFLREKSKYSIHQLAKNSYKKIWMKCDLCFHDFETQPSRLTSGDWCPYCCIAPKKQCKKDLNCLVCFKKSFKSYEGLTPEGNLVIDRWSSKNVKSSYEFFKGSGKCAWFDCDTCSRSFKGRIADISKGRWCSFCKNKTEKKLYRWLQETFPEEEIIKEWKPEWCGFFYITMTSKGKFTYNVNRYCYDFYIPQRKTIIEIDGEQHFRKIKYWKKTLFSVQLRDGFKTMKAKSHGIRIIRICQCDVWEDKNNWEFILQNAIIGNPEAGKNLKKRHREVEKSFISKRAKVK